MSNDTETVVALATGAAQRAEVIVTDSGREFLVLPKDFQAKDVTEENDIEIKLPNTTVANVVLHEVDALIDYVNRFKTEDTVMLADVPSGTVAAHIDYHTSRGANYVRHTAVLTLAHSIEWKSWKAIDGKLLDQTEFVRFIEENAADIRAPDAATVRETVRDFQTHRKASFTKVVRAASGTERFEFTEENRATTSGGIEMPTEFVLGLPVYFGEPHSELHAWLRWKPPHDGDLAIGIALHRAEHVRLAVMRQIALRIADHTKSPVMFGWLK